MILNDVRRGVRRARCEVRGVDEQRRMLLINQREVQLRCRLLSLRRQVNGLRAWLPLLILFRLGSISFLNGFPSKINFKRRIFEEGLVTPGPLFPEWIKKKSLDRHKSQPISNSTRKMHFGSLIVLSDISPWRRRFRVDFSRNKEKPSSPENGGREKRRASQCNECCKKWQLKPAFHIYHLYRLFRGRRELDNLSTGNQVSCWPFPKFISCRQGIIKQSMQILEHVFCKKNYNLSIARHSLEKNCQERQGICVQVSKSGNRLPWLRIESSLRNVWVSNSQLTKIHEFVAGFVLFATF